MSDNECPICKEWVWSWTRHHRCKPLWYARFDDWPDEDARKIYASDASDAAMQFVAEWDAEDTSMMETSTREVFVSSREKPEEWAKFNVSMSWEPTYDAVEVDPDAGDRGGER